MRCAEPPRAPSQAIAMALRHVVERRGGLAREHVAAFAAAAVRGQRRGARQRVAQRRGEGRRAAARRRAARRSAPAARAASPRAVTARITSSATMLLVPSQIEPRCASRTRRGSAPFLDVAAAAAHFHRVAGHLARVAAGAELDERREDAQQRVGGRRRRRRSAPAPAAVWNTMRARLLGRQPQLLQLALHQRHVDQALAEGAALAAR